MSSGIFDVIFSIVHRTFLLSYFRGRWLLDFFCAHSTWTFNEAAIELAAAVPLNDYNSMDMINVWWRKRYRIRLDSFLYLSWFTATINMTVRSSVLFLTDLERHQVYKLDPWNAMFFNSLCSSTDILENSTVYFPFLFTADCLQWSSIKMIVDSVLFDVAVIRYDLTILLVQYKPIYVCLPKIKTKTSNKNIVSFVLS